MCSAAVASTERQRVASKPTLIAYHFHVTFDVETRTAGAILRNLTHQLASQPNDVLDVKTGLFKICSSGR
jgi:hypothetical protein